MLFHREARSAAATVASQYGAGAVNVALGRDAVHRNIEDKGRTHGLTAVDGIVAKTRLLSVKAVSKVKFGTCLFSLGDEELV